jgi:hypothetical protein
MLMRDHAPSMNRRADLHDTNGMSRHRKSAIAVGVLFLAGDVAGVLSVLFMSDLLKEPDYLARIAANQNRMVISALCALSMGLLLAGIPFVMYPIFRRYNEALAVGYVVFRGALETVAYIVGATSSLLLVALSRDYLKAGSPDTAQFGTLARHLKDQGSIATDMTTIRVPLLPVATHPPMACHLGARRRPVLPRRPVAQPLPRLCRVPLRTPRSTGNRACYLAYRQRFRRRAVGRIASCRSGLLLIEHVLASNQHVILDRLR